MTDDYEVGYGRPPKHSQFAKGQSGNKSGRAKGSKNLKTVVEKEANAKVHIREGGKSKTVTKVDALFKAMLNKGIQGDTKAGQIAFGLMEKHLPPPDTQGSDAAPLTKEELSILQNHMELQAALEGAVNYEDDEPE